ncbi:hypothetical protein CEXT_231211 [Caerostris extrusa]|uniref:Uncharacterized protein n=1 Tax=Caerostris extrusa TaxID=172846 RepID=A0AAV4RAW4_CAEEX|nr:hypothetical protein CEXT_231211 [Caerostris extrusa]
MSSQVNENNEKHPFGSDKSFQAYVCRCMQSYVCSNVNVCRNFMIHENDYIKITIFGGRPSPNQQTLDVSCFYRLNSMPSVLQKACSVSVLLCTLALDFNFLGSSVSIFPMRRIRDNFLQDQAIQLDDLTWRYMQIRLFNTANVLECQRILVLES